ncbi:fibronectin type III domain-containing protein [Paenibacillus sp. FJAT-26967]|uniref:fibronectin type III domain-containing protein n=1 Tax=Paenibacillus sp. FJAT-26967 TaxID=1729690 RepID=UPI000839B00F|nr:fibronectin type III domain-containing protein [Paenibacillus sp. FJAT-26967]
MNVYKYVKVVLVAVLVLTSSGISPFLAKAQVASWQSIADPKITSISTVGYSNGNWLIFNTSGSYSYSTDAITWNKGATELDVNSRRCNGKKTINMGYELLVSCDNGDIVALPNGKSPADIGNWEARRSLGDSVNHNLTAIATDGAGTTVVTGQAGAILVSKNGTTWADNRQSGINPYGVAFGEGKFIVTGDNSASKSVLYSSTDGVTWTVVSGASPTQRLRGIAYGNGKFVAVGYSGYIYVSEDGVTWKKENPPSDVSAITYTNLTFGAGKFYATGTKETLISSVDGINWETEMYTGTSSKNYTSVAVTEGRAIVAASDLLKTAVVNTPASNVTTFATTGKTTTTASFSWTAASGATAISIEQSPKGQNNWTTAQTGAIGVSAANATVTGLTPTTEYDFRLVVTGGTNAGNSNVVSLQTATPIVPVADFATTGKTTTTASFSWTAANGATAIIVEQSPKGQNTWTTAQTGAIGVSAASATVTGLTPTTEYDFRLVVTGGTNAGNSNVVSLQTATPIVPVADFATTGKTTTTASFSWTAANGATAISIEQSPKGQNNWTTAQTGAIGVSAASATVTGLTPTTEYDFRLVVTGGTNAGNSNVVSLQTDTPIVPVADFATTGKTTTTASFSWTAANGATAIIVEQSPKGQNTWTTAQTGAIGVSAASATVTGLTPTTEYDFRLVVTGGTNAGNSNVVSLQTDTPIVPVADFATTGKTTTTASFSWTAANGATAIIVEQSPKGQNTWTTAQTGAIGVSAASATVTGLTPTTEYDFRLVVTGGTNAGNSNVVSLQTATPIVPVADFATTGKTTTTASFSWTAASGATAIIVEQSPKGQNTWTTAQTGAIGVSAASATVTGLTPTTEYDFRLVVTGGTNAGNSNVVSLQTDTPIVPVADFATTGKTTTTASFSWTAANGATAIIVEQSPKGQNTWTTAQTGAIGVSAASATVTGLIPTTEYDFRLVVTGGTNAGNSNVVSLQTDTPIVPVADFATTGKTTTTASFSWTAANGATAIIVEQSPKGQNTWTTAQTGAIGVSAASATVTGLTPTTEYDFRLVVTGGTNAGNSNVVSLQTDTPIVPVADFATTGKTTTTASFSWTAANGATAIIVEQSPKGQNTWTTAQTGAIGVSAASATVSSLTPTTEYDFRLVVTGGTNAGNSNVVSLQTATPIVPVADFATTGKTTTTASFSWTAANGATAIIIEQSPKGQNTWTTAQTGAIGVSAASATVTGLAPTTEYDFRLVVTGGTNAGNSNVVSLQTDTPIVPVADFATTGKTTTTASFSWTAANGATAIIVEQSPKGQNTWTTAQTGAIGVSAASATVSSLTPTTEYDFRLVVTGGTNAGNSNVVSLQTDTPIVPVADFATTGKTTTTASFSWTAANGATAIIVEQSPKGQNTWTTAQTGAIGVSAASATVTGLTPSTEYDFRLVIIGGTNAGTSNEVSVTTPAALTYSLYPIGDQTLNALVIGYASGTQEIRNIGLFRTGTGKLSNLSVSLSGTNAGDFEITQPVLTELNATNLNTDFTVKAKDGLAAGTYTTQVTISATNMTDVTLTVTQVVNLPNVPANPQNLTAAAGDRQVELNWSTVTGATYYDVYRGTASGVYDSTPIATVTGATYLAKDLTNGTTYYFIVKAGNPGGSSAASNEVSATPGAVPLAPTNVTAVAGNGEATITFTAPINNGGLPIIQYEVTVSPGNTIVTNASSPVTITGLTNGTSYTFTVKAINAAGKSEASAASNAVIPAAPSGGGDNGGGNGGNTGSPSPNPDPQPQPNGVDVIINGKPVNAGTLLATSRNGQKVVTVSVNEEMLKRYLEGEGKGAVVVVPVTTESDVYEAELNGRMVKHMEAGQAVIEISTDSSSYILPSQQIGIDVISRQFGQSVELQDIKIYLQIAEPSADIIRLMNEAAKKGGFETVVLPLNFTVQAVYDGRTITVNNFNSYVERTMLIPDGVDLSRITTGVAVEPNGTVRHVPTKVMKKDGKYYAIINSLSSGTYAVVWHPLEFKDVEGHWSEQFVNDMGSRMVVSGVGSELFQPDRDITRAEFAAIIIRGLGIKLDNGKSSFADLNSSDWYYDTVYTAHKYDLISGFEDGTFRPEDRITREQAMVILSKAMLLTGLKQKQADSSVEEQLKAFTDALDVSGWARSGIADSVQAGIVTGRNGGKLAPKAFITRAEVAATLQRLLQKSDLI